MNNKNLVKMILTGSLCGVIGTSLLTYGCSTEYNSPEAYNNNATVIYDDKEYLLKDLYKLTSDDETHLCRLEKRSHTEIGYGITSEGKLGYMYTTKKDPGVYIDMKTNQEIAIEGYEGVFGYTVEKLIDYFPYEEYGSKDKVCIQQEKIDEIIKVKTK